jgi:hypothetical protein
MNIRTVRATANNLIEAMEIARRQNINVMVFELRKNDRENATKTAKRYNEEIDGLVKMLCTLYITCLDNYDKYSEELNERMRYVNNLRTSIWDAYDVIESEKTA